MSGLISSLDDRRVLFCVLVPFVAIPGKDPTADSCKRFIPNNKHVPLSSIVGYGRAAKLRLESVTRRDAPYKPSL